MINLVVLYGHPANPDEFERYYANTHLPITAGIKGAARVELTRCTSAPDGSRPAFYRMAEFLFDSPEQMSKTMDSPAAKAAVADLANFATGGVTVMVGDVQDVSRLGGGQQRV
jgi:uncharacterized protein (TIGR02118 family)